MRYCEQRMTLRKQNVGLNEPCVASEGPLSLVGLFGGFGLIQRLNFSAFAAYGNRRAEMKRTETQVDQARNTSLAVSQFSRQMPK